MKKITVVNVDTIVNPAEKNPLCSEDKMIIECCGSEEMDANDGYHTFTELYEHRVALFIKVCEIIHKLNNKFFTVEVWRSKLHSDGTSLDGWFIMGIGKAMGKQMTYHLPLSVWGETYFAEILDRAPEYDGHTAADVLERLKTL